MQDAIEMKDFREMQETHKMGCSLQDVHDMNKVFAYQEIVEIKNVRQGYQKTCYFAFCCCC